MIYREIMHPMSAGFLISEDATLASAARQISNNEGRPLIVIREDAPVGILQGNTVLKAWAEGASSEMDVKNLPLEPVRFVEKSEPVSLHDFGGGCLCIVSGKKTPMAGVAIKAEILEKTVIATKEKIKSAIVHLGYTGKQKSSKEHLDTELDILVDNVKLLWKALSLSPDSILVIDNKGDVLFVNDKFAKMALLPNEQFIGRNVTEMAAAGYFDVPVSLMVIKSKKEVTIRQHSGLYDTYWIVTGAPIFNDQGEVDMVVTNAKSIGEYKKYHEYEEDRKKSIQRLKENSGSGQYVLMSGRHMQTILDLAEKAAEVDSTVLITGESGVGKGVIARHIHQKSARCNEKMVEINCSSIPETLFESEFFGYESGAFTGAKTSGKQGILELADKGTLFLDELGDMPLSLQSKLLRVLQDRKFTRVGGLDEVNIDVRVIAATNQPIEELVDSGRFRADLYYRLNMFPIHIKPLRERPDEIPVLIAYFLALGNQKHLKNVGLSPQIISALSKWSWPGNIRQLEYYIERIVILFSGEVKEKDLMQINGRYEEKETSLPDLQSAAAFGNRPVEVREIVPLEEALAETEKQLFMLAACGGKNSYQVAAILKTSQPNAYRKMKKYCE